MSPSSPAPAASTSRSTPTTTPPTASSSPSPPCRPPTPSPSDRTSSSAVDSLLAARRDAVDELLPRQLPVVVAGAVGDVEDQQAEIRELFERHRAVAVAAAVHDLEAGARALDLDGRVGAAAGKILVDRQLAVMIGVETGELRHAGLPDFRRRHEAVLVEIEGLEPAQRGFRGGGGLLSGRGGGEAGAEGGGQNERMSRHGRRSSRIWRGGGRAARRRAGGGGA